MRSSKAQKTLNLKLMIFICSVFLFLVFLKLGFFSSSLESFQSNVSDSVAPCNKIPPSLSNALVHYASSNITPQQTLPELSVTLRVRQKKSPCNFLVFGLGNDNLMWSSLNYGGRTMFLEEDNKWMGKMKRDMPSMEAYHVVYQTRVSQASALLGVGKEEDCKVVEDPRLSKCKLAIKTFPSEVYAPTGFRDDLPGRMSAIYTAGLMARNRKHGTTEVFVHDIDRWVEDKFSIALLCEGYWREHVGRLRRFTIPSHSLHSDWSFCP